MWYKFRISGKWFPKSPFAMIQQKEVRKREEYNYAPVCRKA